MEIWVITCDALPIGAFTDYQDCLEELYRLGPPVCYRSRPVTLEQARDHIRSGGVLKVCREATANDVARTYYARGVPLK